ncbi:MAG TPA: diguanylate cyclase [Thermodesulfobacteriota bacterium]
MEKRKENKKLDFLSDLFEYSLRNDFVDTISYLGIHSTCLIPNLSLFVSVNVEAKECLVLAHRKVKRSYLSSILENISEVASKNSLVLELSEYKTRVLPQEEFTDAEGPNHPNFVLTVPIFAGGKSRAFLSFSKSGYLGPEANDVSYFISLIADFLSALWEREAKEILERRNIEKLSFVDSLTEVFNRRAFHKLFSQDLAEARRNSSPLSLVVFDIDGFKQINDSHGHSFGDMILKRITSEFKRLLREEDKMFRLGGDEFAVLVKADKEVTYSVIDRIVKRISSIRTVSITLSGGIVEINPYDGVSVDDLMKQADKTLYLAKESGRNQILFFEDGKAKIKSEGLLLDKVVDSLTDDTNLRLKELATEQLFSIYSSLTKIDKSIYEKPKSVSEYVIILGKELSLPENRLQNLRLGAFLYDIGMIAVPESIILKGTNLTHEEYELIRQHTIIGGRIIRRLPILRELLAIVLYHHEWINGKGYPFGLIGDSIPIEARIIAVADAFYSMQNNRPYRPALSKEESISEIIKGRGIKYDSLVVEAFLALIERRIIAAD